jgi:hypothetical protein
MTPKAVAVLQAVVRRNEAWLGLAMSLAAQVLAQGEVKLAMEVLAGGPFARSQRRKRSSIELCDALLARARAE